MSHIHVKGGKGEKVDNTPASELLLKNVEETEKVKNEIAALRKRLKTLKAEHVCFFGCDT